MKPNSTYCKILNIRRLPIPSQPVGTTYLRLWFSVFSIGMSVSHVNQCLKFYLLMNTICQTPTMILFTAVSSWILLQGSLLMCFPTVRKPIFSIILVILNMKHIPIKLTPASWIASNMFQLTCLNRSALSSNRIVRRTSSVSIVFMFCSISLKISMQFDEMSQGNTRPRLGVFIDKV